ncbi:ABC transporter ATP-binding protein [Devosia sp. MC1541]|uniref:ABC transporter ATP-binding protein n=1 Tax=Devosia sp. MC1541 TaxID=2725264 RepID=UPI00145CDF38|nr:ABC transporter ATP-binding protein [Devosia sp. MC1541]
MQQSTFLRVEGVSVRFGGINALTDVSLNVPKNRVTSVIGPNGAGKTTLFNAISGFYPVASGTIEFMNNDLVSKPASVRAHLGISRTFQNLALFPGMSVLENIKLGVHPHLKAGLFAGLVYFGKARREEIEATRQIDESVLDMLDIREYRDKAVSGLPYGVLKRIELARALVMKPSLLLLDEPFAGMNHTDKSQMAVHIRRIIDNTDVTALLIDHHMDSVMAMSDQITVLNFGKVIAAGTPDEVRRDKAVIDAYLGQD